MVLLLMKRALLEHFRFEPLLQLSGCLCSLLLRIIRHMNFDSAFRLRYKYINYRPAELATTVVAARKGNSGIAIGNVLGSNVFNILLILGATGVICPMELQGIMMTDFSMMGFSMILLWLFSFTKYEIERWEGAFFIALFVGYMATLL